MLRVALYRFSIKLRINPAQWVKVSVPTGPFFTPLAPTRVGSSRDSQNRAWETSALLFGRWRIDIQDTPPDWHCNAIDGRKAESFNYNWWEIPDFHAEVGDIKVVWEPSRFDWVLSYARGMKGGDHYCHHRLEVWLADWASKNPPYRGPNWKCGQEASIRVMHIAMAAIVIDQALSPTKALMHFVLVHLQRIAPTLSYAIGQENNHGTSEAAALFIGGSWLAAQNIAPGEKWAALGRKWLENRAQRLLASDGTFSQYSVNYHRVMLDTYCMAEVWRRKLRLAQFSSSLISKMRAASSWLHEVTRAENGDVPNIGANDGARFLPLTETDYRDFRPTVQLSTSLFFGKRAYKESGAWDQPLYWLGVPLPDGWLANHEPSCASNGAMLGRLKLGDALAVLKYPVYFFRPSQSDALHLDFWINGRNLLRDGGSYSYNTTKEWLSYFGGVRSHNTVQFDDQDQMPRLGRFLFGDWLKAANLEPPKMACGMVTCAAAYHSRIGARHARHVTLTKSELRVRDEIGGFAKSAVLRWRLEPGQWVVDGSTVTNGFDVLSIDSDGPLKRFELTRGWESRYYLERTEIPVLEIEVDCDCTLFSTYRWTQ